MTVTSSYFGPILRQKRRDEIVKDAIRDLMPHRTEFDSVAYRGNSGACMAPVLAWIFKKHLLVVRKTADGSHSSYAVEGEKDSLKVLIVDDFIGQGGTVKAILEALKAFNPDAQVVGFYGYLRRPDKYKTDFLRDKGIEIPIWGRTGPDCGYT